MRNFENFLQKTGWGHYHRFVLFFSGFNIICDTTAIMTLPFAIPSAACELNFTTTNVLLTNAVFTTGSCVGGLVTGVLSDVCYRKCQIPFTILLLFISHFCCGFSCDIVMFNITNFFIGFSAAGNLICVKVNFCEILPKDKRGHYVIILDMCFYVGYILSSSINWAMKSSRADHDSIISWRMTFGLASCLSILCASLSGLIQPNPRMLLMRRRKLETILVLKYMYSVNNSDHAENFKVQVIEIDGLIEENYIEREREITKCREAWECLYLKIRNLFKRIGRREHWKNILLIGVIKCALFAGYLMNNIWLLKSLRLDMDLENCYFTSLQLLHFVNVKNTEQNPCESLIPTRFFLEFIGIASSGLFGLIAIVCLIDILGRRAPLILALLSCGTSAIFFTLFPGYIYRVILSVIYMMGFAVACAILDLIIIENLPTSIRCTGLSLSHLPAGVLSIISKICIDTPCKITFYCIVGMTLAASIFSYFLPDLKRNPMVE